jgi:general stress protein 26
MVWFMTLRSRFDRRLALLFRAWGQRRHRPGAAAVLGAAQATMQRKRYCLLATAGRDGVSARVLQPFAPGPGLDVWLGTSATSRKVTELRANPQATLVYQDDARSACAVLSGTIEIVDGVDARRQRFMSSWYAFWPDGPESADFLLLHFSPEVVEVWDATRGITPEPFGLRGARLERRAGEWQEA